MDCVFCKIVSGELPCLRVYEDENLMAFLDISPVVKGHTLVISKKHYANLLETPDELNGQMFSAAKKVALAFQKSLGAQGFNLLQNNGSCAGQLVEHIHTHVIPRFPGDGKNLIPVGKDKYSSGEAEKLSSDLGETIMAL